MDVKPLPEFGHPPLHGLPNKVGVSAVWKELFRFPGVDGEKPIGGAKVFQLIKDIIQKVGFNMLQNVNTCYERGFFRFTGYLGDSRVVFPYRNFVR